MLTMGLVAAVAAGATILLLLLFGNTTTRKEETRQTSLRVVELNETTDDPAIWGKDFPRQYDSYLRTSEHTGTKHGGWGSETIPASRIEEDPRLVTMFDGYAFVLDTISPGRGSATLS